MSKKLFILIVCFVLAISLSACKKKTINSTTTNQTTTESETTKSIITTTLEESTTLLPKTSDITTTEEITTTLETDIDTLDNTTNTNSFIPTSDTERVRSYYSDFDFDEFVSMSTSNRTKYIKDYISVTLKGQSYDSAKIYFYKTDENPETGKIQLFYTHLETSADSNNKVSFGSSNGTINREHVWPQSLGDTKNQQGGYDLHHIRPTLFETNTARGNKIYGNVAHTSSNEQKYNGVTYAYMTSSTFEPVDDVKGDVARIVFYYSIVYGYDLKIIVSDDTFKEILEWNKLDPVSDVEINRNNAVEDIQSNRNIFIDYPELADYIWGNN